MQLASRVAKLENIGGLVDTVEDQEYTVVVGLMLLDMLLLPALPPNRASATQNARGMLGNLFKKVRG